VLACVDVVGVEVVVLGGLLLVQPASTAALTRRIAIASCFMGL
jgi:hypothetical protein